MQPSSRFLLYLFLVGFVLMLGCGDAPDSTVQKPEIRFGDPPDQSAPPAKSKVLTYDREAYMRLTKFLETDRAGMPIDEFLSKVGLAGAEFTVLDTPNMGPGERNRLYHFAGFYLDMDVACEIPTSHTSAMLAELHERNQVYVGSMYPYVEIDGLHDPEERLRVLQEKWKSPFVATDSFPRLRLESVTKPDDQSHPIQIALQLSADGTTPLALSQQQFSVSISTKYRPWLFTCRAVFPEGDKKIFTVEPDQPISLQFSTSPNDKGRRWSSLMPDSYVLRVYVGGPKNREFDYQWSGQTYSDDFTLVIE